ncbi:hypothetical protein Fmac_013747 [Flemingia macrophylla]|uniref:Uncharacterized protein n=1 Tax=Flemingia macrophylla TaxID=520843 RepID=A0ABD1MUH6_9FABA
MGTAQSANRKRLFPILPSARYHHLRQSSESDQPLLQHFNPKFTEIEDEVETHWEKSCSLEKTIEGDKQKAMTSLKENFDNLKKSLDQEIKGREADIRTYSAGMVLKRLEEKHIQVKKEIAELKTRIDEMTSTIIGVAGVIANNDELKHKSHEPKVVNESSEVKITNVGMITISKEGLYIILIFLIAVLIGLNL